MVTVNGYLRALFLKTWMTKGITQDRQCRNRQRCRNISSVI